MTQEALDMCIKAWDEHFSREFLLCLGIDKASETGILTKDELGKLKQFMQEHPHKTTLLKYYKSIPETEKYAEKLENVIDNI